MGQMFGCIAMVLFLGFGLWQIYGGFVGATEYVGAFFALLIIGGSMALRLSLPITVFAFLAAKNVWDWPWYGAALFAAPGLLLVVPNILAQVIGSFSKLLQRN